MEIEQIILIVLSGLGVFHGFLVAALLWNYKGALRTSNRLLSALMVILSLRIGKSVILGFSLHLETLYIYLGLCLLTFIGPLFFLYSRSASKKSNVLSKREWLHFLPGIFLLILAIPFQFFGFANIPHMFVESLFLLFYCHPLAYLFTTKYQYINTSSLKETKQWLDLIFYGLILLWIVYVLNIFEDKIPYISGSVMYSIIVYTITFLAISRRYIQHINAVRYKTASFSDDEVDLLLRNFEAMMNKDFLYLSPHVSLAGLSKQLKVSAQKLSFAINSRSGYNFNEYINRLRIKKAVEMLQSPKSKDVTIAAIAYDAGFNNLSSFNAAFKKFTGKTPSEYRKT